MTDTTTEAPVEPITGAALARMVHAYITEHPDEFDMESWAEKKGCGTSMCLAGTAVFLNGARFIFPEPDGIVANLYDEVLASRAVMPDGRNVDIGDEAHRLLGLPPIIDWDAEPSPVGVDGGETRIFHMTDAKARRWIAEYAETGLVPSWGVQADDEVPS